MEAPNAANPNTDIADPKRDMLLRAKVEPMLVNPNTDKVAPTRAIRRRDSTALNARYQGLK